MRAAGNGRGAEKNSINTSYAQPRVGENRDRHVLSQPTGEPLLRAGGDASKTHPDLFVWLAGLLVCRKTHVSCFRCRHNTGFSATHPDAICLQLPPTHPRDPSLAEFTTPAIDSGQSGVCFDAPGYPGNRPAEWGGDRVWELTHGGCAPADSTCQGYCAGPRQSADGASSLATWLPQNVASAVAACF